MADQFGCSICHKVLGLDDDFLTEVSEDTHPLHIGPVQLNCGHLYHYLCFISRTKESSFLQCATCEQEVQSMAPIKYEGNTLVARGDSINFNAINMEQVFWKGDRLSTVTCTETRSTIVDDVIIDTKHFTIPRLNDYWKPEFDIYHEHITGYPFRDILTTKIEQATDADKDQFTKFRTWFDFKVATCYFKIFISLTEEEKQKIITDLEQKYNNEPSQFAEFAKNMFKQLEVIDCF